MPLRRKCIIGAVVVILIVKGNRGVVPRSNISSCGSGVVVIGLCLLEWRLISGGGQVGHGWDLFLHWGLGLVGRGGFSSEGGHRLARLAKGKRRGGGGVIITGITQKQTQSSEFTP